MYVPLWVDDTNPENERLFIKGGEITKRVAGEIYYSRDVRFVKHNTDFNRVSPIL